MSKFESEDVKTLLQIGSENLDAQKAIANVKVNPNPACILMQKQQKVLYVEALVIAQELEKIRKASAQQKESMLYHLIHKIVDYQTPQSLGKFLPSGTKLKPDDSFFNCDACLQDSGQEPVIKGKGEDTQTICQNCHKTELNFEEKPKLVGAIARCCIVCMHQNDEDVCEHVAKDSNLMHDFEVHTKESVDNVLIELYRTGQKEGLSPALFYIRDLMPDVEVRLK